LVAQAFIGLWVLYSLTFCGFASPQSELLTRILLTATNYDAGPEIFLSVMAILREPAMSWMPSGILVRIPTDATTVIGVGFVSRSGVVSDSD